MVNKRYSRSKQQLLDAISTIVFLTLLIYAAYRDLSYLTQYPFAVGVDGYYYVLQVSQILKNGHLYFSNGTPLILCSLSGLAALIDNPVLAIKIGAVVLQLLLSIGINAILRVTGHSRNLSYLGALLAAFLGLHFNFVSEFINNLGAIVILIWCFVVLIRGVKNKSYILSSACGVLFIAANFSHRSILPITLLLGILAGIAYQLLYFEISFARRICVLLLLLLIFISPALVDAQRIFDIPTIIKTEISMHPGFPFGPVAIAEKLILSIAAPLALFFLSGLPKVSRKSPQSHLICITALWSLVITLNPFLNHGLGWDGTVTRLNGLSYVQIAILLPGLIWLSTLVQKDSWLYLVALFTPFFVLSVSASLPTGMQAAYLHNRSQIIEEFPKQIPNIVPGALIIAEQGTQFVVTFASGLPAQNLLPRSESSRLDIYWVLFGVKPHMLGEPMTKLAIGDRGTFTVLIRNEELKKYLSLLADGDRRYLFAVNSHLYQTCINANLSTLLGECTQLP